MNELDNQLINNIITSHKENLALPTYIGSFHNYAQIAHESPIKFEQLMDELDMYFSGYSLKWGRKTFRNYRSLLRRAIKLSVSIINIDGNVKGKTAIEKECQEKELHLSKFEMDLKKH